MEGIFRLNPTTSGNGKETYGFNSTKTPPQISELIYLERKLAEMIANIKFSNQRCEFRKELSSEFRTIKKSTKLIIPADKTSNYYTMDMESYNTLLSNKITQSYKKVQIPTLTNISGEAKT